MVVAMWRVRWKHMAGGLNRCYRADDIMNQKRPGVRWVGMSVPCQWLDGLRPCSQTGLWYHVNEFGGMRNQGWIAVACSCSKDVESCRVDGWLVVTGSKWDMGNDGDDYRINALNWQKWLVGVENWDDACKWGRNLSCSQTRSRGCCRS